VCVLALGIQHAMRRRWFVISGLIGSTISFHTVSQTARFSGGKKLMDKKCVLIFLQRLSASFPNLGRTERSKIKNVYWFSCKVHIIVRFNENGSSSTYFRKTLKYQIS
jgi:hypothetical protein